MALALLIAAIFGILAAFGNPTGNVPPYPYFVSSPETGQAPLEVQFSAEGSTDYDGSIEEYRWLFDDGVMSTGSEVTHVFQRPGTYDVTLMVRDDRGAVAALERSIEVLGSPGSSSARGVAPDVVSLASEAGSPTETGNPATLWVRPDIQSILGGESLRVGDVGWIGWNPDPSGVFGAGISVALHDVQLVHSVRGARTPGYARMLILVDVEIASTGPNYLVTPDDFALAPVDGIAERHDVIHSCLHRPLATCQISSGESIRGEVLFDVPDARKFILVFSGAFGDPIQFRFAL